MDAIIINRDILLDEDFTGDFREKLCDYLNGLIDSELAKGDETDFDLIDEYADAINRIRDGEADGILPVISKHDFYKALGINLDGGFAEYWYAKVRTRTCGNSFSTASATALTNRMMEPEGAPSSSSIAAQAGHRQ